MTEPIEVTWEVKPEPDAYPHPDVVYNVQSLFTRWPKAKIIIRGGVVEIHMHGYGYIVNVDERFSFDMGAVTGNTINGMLGLIQQQHLEEKKNVPTGQAIGQPREPVDTGGRDTRGEEAPPPNRGWRKWLSSRSLSAYLLAALYRIRGYRPHQAKERGE